MIQTFLLDIGPVMANELLKNNINNYRKPDKRIVSKYAQDMKDGKWQENCEPIVFNESGELVNGQHRLLAIIESGCTITMLVVRGVSNQVTLFDTGKSRSIQQNLRGIVDKYITTVTSIAILVVSNFYSNVYSQSMVIDYAKAHKDDLQYCASLITSNGSIIAYSAIGLAAYLKLRSGVSRDDLAMFFKVARTGYADDRRDSTPAIALRNTII